ncbi:MAG: aminopeptidase [Bacilli bacterium]|nr:aminopeptidase [Bacilli bacterium]
MQMLHEKYADMLLEKCLTSKSLHISFDIECFELVALLEEKASLAGIKDIYLEIEDEQLEQDFLIGLQSEKDLDILSLHKFNKNSFNKYALKNASFIVLKTKKDIIYNNDNCKTEILNLYKEETRKIFNEKRNNNELNIIYGVLPNPTWARKTFPENYASYEKLLTIIMENYNDDNIIDKINTIENILENGSIKK